MSQHRRNREIQEEPYDRSSIGRRVESGWFTKFSAEEQVPPLVQPEAPELLTALLWDGLPTDVLNRIKDILRMPLFDRHAERTSEEAAALAYERATFVARELGLLASELMKDPKSLYALHEWLSVSDGTACTILSIHYCLAMGSIIMHGQGRRELQPLLEELERLDTIGVFLATELGYGNNVASLETRATYDRSAKHFVLCSPSARSMKFMPNTAHPVPKLGVVMARLFSQEKDCGVFPFVVRIRDDAGQPCPGVHILPLPEKPGYPLDNAMTRFDRVLIPKAHLLTGPDSTLDEDGTFASRVPNRHRRFLNAMDRVQTGRVCFTSGAVAVLRAATWIAIRYTSQRLTFAPKKRGATLLSHRNVQRDVIGSLAACYALTFAVRQTQAQFASRTLDSEAESFLRVAIIKAVASEESAQFLWRLRERCGAAGLFGENRISEYLAQIQGVITAEGDNEMMFLKVARQLCALPPAPPAHLTVDAAEGPLDLDILVELLQYRVARLIQDLRATRKSGLKEEAEPGSLFQAYNRNINALIELARSYGQSLIAASFLAVVRRGHPDEVEYPLKLLLALWCSRLVERHVGWYWAEGCLTVRTGKRLSRVQDELCEKLEPYLPLLSDAFGFDNTILRAPIAGQDYVEEYFARHVGVV